MADQVDSLEDWVSIKDNPFLDTSPKIQLNFIVAWNDIEDKVAITCRQRQNRNSADVVKAWSGVFSFLELRAIHNQLSLVHPSLGTYLPCLPNEPSGLWAYMVSKPEFDEEQLLSEIHAYLKIAEDICGHSLLTSTYFEEHTEEEYFEKISELKSRKYDEAITLADDLLSNILYLRDGSVNMLDMREVYVQEDEAVFKLNVAIAELYNYQIQPFLDMREIACSKLREAKAGLQNPNYGKRRKDEYKVMFAEWQENYIHALDRIQEVYMEYYSKTVQLQNGK